MTHIQNIGVLASGRGSNFEALVKAEKRGDLRAHIALLICDREDAAALQIARTYGVNAIYIHPGKFRTKLAPEAEQTYIDMLKSYNIRLVCLAGFMRILHENLLNSFRVLNIHPSLLPAFPGLHVQQQALAYGAKYSGCTVHFVDGGIDTGPIVKQAVVPVLDDDTVETLSQRILEQEHQIYWQAVNLVVANSLEFQGRRVIQIT